MLLVHGAWVAVYLAIAMQRHRYRAELRQAQLGEALRPPSCGCCKSQLNPHFLFNALNGLRSLIADDPGRAREAVTQLARTLAVLTRLRRRGPRVAGARARDGRGLPGARVDAARGAPAHRARHRSRGAPGAAAGHAAADTGRECDQARHRAAQARRHAAHQRAARAAASSCSRSSIRVRKTRRPATAKASACAMRRSACDCCSANARSLRARSVQAGQATAEVRLPA